MIIDANNLILGRLASFVAKKLLMGENIDIVNAEKAVIGGKPKNTLAHYEHKRKRGDVFKGPFFYRNPERLMKRTIRGMLPHKQERGRKAFKNIKCYIGVPDMFKDKKIETVESANIKKSRTTDYISIGNLVKLIGFKK